MRETYEYRPSGRSAIPYRIRPSSAEPTEDGTVTWFVEYMQNPKRGEWDWRATVFERDDGFWWGDTRYDSPRAALMARVSSGP